MDSIPVKLAHHHCPFKGRDQYGCQSFRASFRVQLAVRYPFADRTDDEVLPSVHRLPGLLPEGRLGVVCLYGGVWDRASTLYGPVLRERAVHLHSADETLQHRALSFKRLLQPPEDEFRGTDECL